MFFNRRGLVYLATGALTTAAGMVNALTGANAQSTATSSGTAKASSGSAHIFSFPALKGGDIHLADLKGKVVLVVNTASYCGFSNQFKDLETLWTQYKDQGLVVIGVPANDFGNQEPGTSEDIAQMCSTEFGVDFPMTAKQVVKGEGAHPFYKWAAKQRPGDVPRWNFFKYLIGKDGSLIGAFGTMTNPLDRSVVTTIEVALSSGS